MSNWTWLEWMLAYLIFSVVFGVMIAREDAEIKYVNQNRRLRVGERWSNLALGLAWPLLLPVYVLATLVDKLPEFYRKHCRPGREWLLVKIWRFVMEPKHVRKGLK